MSDDNKRVTRLASLSSSSSNTTGGKPGRFNFKPTAPQRRVNSSAQPTVVTTAASAAKKDTASGNISKFKPKSKSRMNDINAQPALGIFAQGLGGTGLGSSRTGSSSSSSSSIGRISNVAAQPSLSIPSLSGSSSVSSLSLAHSNQFLNNNSNDNNTPVMDNIELLPFDLLALEKYKCSDSLAFTKDNSDSMELDNQDDYKCFDTENEVILLQFPPIFPSFSYQERNGEEDDMVIPLDAAVEGQIGEIITFESGRKILKIGNNAMSLTGNYNIEPGTIPKYYQQAALLSNNSCSMFSLGKLDHKFLIVPDIVEENRSSI